MMLYKMAYKTSYVEDFWLSVQLYFLPVIWDFTDSDKHNMNI